MSKLTVCCKPAAVSSADRCVCVCVCVDAAGNDEVCVWGTVPGRCVRPPTQPLQQQAVVLTDPPLSSPAPPQLSKPAATKDRLLGFGEDGSLLAENSGRRRMRPYTGLCRWYLVWKLKITSVCGIVTVILFQFCCCSHIMMMMLLLGEGRSGNERQYWVHLVKGLLKYDTFAFISYCGS